MDKKILLILVMSIFLVSLVSSVDTSIGIVKQGNTIQLTQLCSNCTYVNLTQVLYPNNTYALTPSQNSMTKTGENFNYTWTDTNTFGNYFYTTCGDLNGIVTCQNIGFKVTQSGKILSSGQAMIYLGLLFLLIFLFLIDISSLILIPKENNRDPENGEIVSINMLRLLKPVLYGFAWGLLLSIFFISSNVAFAYLETELFAKFLFVIFQIMFVLTPIIVIFWGWYLLYHVVQDIAINKILKQGGSVF